MVNQFQHGPLTWHDDLYKAILAEQASSPRSALGVSSGPTWSGRKGLQSHAAAQPLLALFRERLFEVSGSNARDLALWANVTLEGGACGEHDHEDGRNAWSGVYYLTGGAPIVFPACGLTIEPEPGLLLLFAATERHYVSPQVSAAPRVSVAMNAISSGTYSTK